MSGFRDEENDSSSANKKKRERTTFADPLEVPKSSSVNHPTPVKETTNSHKPNIISGNTPSSSPPNKKFTTMEDLIKTNDAAANLVLCHEINLDEKFQLPEPNYDGLDRDPATMSSEEKLHSAVHSAVHRAFWDLLSGDLNSNPPVFKHAFVLLEEIKGLLLSLLPADRVTSLHKRINEGLDMDLLKQQAAHNALDIRSLALFLIDTMASMCAPVRDDEVAKLRTIDDIIELLKGIYKLLGMMKRDFVNFSISSIRPLVQQHHIKYERQRFAEILAKLPNGLETTEKWLRSCNEDLQEDSELRTSLSPNLTSTSTATATIKPVTISPLTVLKRAFIKLLHWEDGKPFPETVLVDQARFSQLRIELKRLLLTASVLLTTFSSLKADLATQQAFVLSIKEELLILLKPNLIEKELPKTLDGVAEHVLHKTSQFLQTLDSTSQISDEKKEAFKKQINALADLQVNSVYRVLVKRVHEYLHAMTDYVDQHKSLASSTLAVPPGLQIVSAELTTLAASYAKLVNLNRTVYGPFYVPILRQALDLPSSPSISPMTSPRDQNPKQSGAKKRLDMDATQSSSTASSNGTAEDH